MSVDLDELASVAERLADAAGAAALPWFRSAGLGADNKAPGGRFDPVTEGDRAAEAAMRAVLAELRPADGILGEEEGASPGTSGLTWVLDPIDGTRGFLAGTPTWGVLIGLDDGARSILGIIDQPYTGERWLGIPGRGTTFRRGGGAAHAMRVRPCPDLGAAVMMTTDADLFPAGERKAFDALRARVRLCRLGTDCYAYALLASGQVDLVVESGLQAYDVGALIPVIEAAGGIITDWRGGDCRGGGRVLAAGDPARHAEALEVLSRVD